MKKLLIWLETAKNLVTNYDIYFAIKEKQMYLTFYSYFYLEFIA